MLDKQEFFIILLSFFIVVRLVSFCITLPLVMTGPAAMSATNQSGKQSTVYILPLIPETKTGP